MTFTEDFEFLPRVIRPWWFMVKEMTGTPMLLVVSQILACSLTNHDHVEVGPIFSSMDVPTFFIKGERFSFVKLHGWCFGSWDRMFPLF
jgi:hypothetical protein